MLGRGPSTWPSSDSVRGRTSACIALASPADPDVIYHKAIVEALTGRSDAALTTLREAVARGYSPSEARSDNDLASLKGRPEFAAALAAHH